MKLTTAPLIYDLDVNGNQAPTVTPAASVQPLTFNLSGLDGRIDDMWPMAQALVVRVTFTLTQASGAVLNYDKLYRAVDSFQLSSQILGDVLAQRSGQGAALGLIDQYVANGYRPTSVTPAQVSGSNGDYTIDLYYRIPFAFDWGKRPQDGGIWLPLFEKGKLVVNMNTTAADLFQSGASIKAAAATVRAWFEVLPVRDPVIHAPWKPVRYEFQTAGNTLKLFTFGTGDGLLGVQPGARLSFLAWLSNLHGLGGVDTIEKFNRISMQWRKQKVTVNPESYLIAFLGALGKRAAQVGSIGSGTINDRMGWPYTMAGGPDNSVLNATGLFMPFVFPGHNAGLAGTQKQIGDLNIDVGWSSAPNGTHVLRTHEHFCFTPEMVKTLIGLYGFSPKTHTAEPKLADNSDPRDISPAQQWGLPLRILPRSIARRPVV